MRFPAALCKVVGYSRKRGEGGKIVGNGIEHVDIRMRQHPLIVTTGPSA